MYTRVLWEVRPVYARIRIGGQGVCYEVAKRGLHDEYSRVWSYQERNIRAVVFQRRVGPDDGR